MPKSLVWLASYPKSGNTWLRAFLANYFYQADRAIPLSKIHQVSFGDSGFEAYARRAPIDHRHLNPGQLLRLRTDWLTEISHRGPVNFVKTHNAHTRLGPGWWIPAALTHSAIYILRDPRDMVLSYADHWGIPVERAAAQIADKRNQIQANAKSVTQFLGSWSTHVEGWAKAREFRTIVVRYEDMLTQPDKEFARILTHIGAPVEAKGLAQAVERSSFSTLARDEASNGFSERGPQQETFFRSGTSGGWRSTLPPDLAAQIWQDHRSVMRRYKYTEA
ncbi:MAG: sulfotransferase domain-containing protein [Pseudomonadota bacterium]